MKTIYPDQQKQKQLAILEDQRGDTEGKAENGGEREKEKKQRKKMCRLGLRDKTRVYMLSLHMPDQDLAAVYGPPS